MNGFVQGMIWGSVLTLLTAYPIFRSILRRVRLSAGILTGKDRIQMFTYIHKAIYSCTTPGELNTCQHWLNNLGALDTETKQCLIMHIKEREKTLFIKRYREV